MTTLISADLHFSDNPRDEYRFNIFKTLRRIAREHDVEQILLLGDLTESKDRHSAWLVNRIADGLYDLAKSYKIDILKGNHDYVAADNPFFAFLRHVKNIQWFNEPAIMPGNDWLLLPHTNDWEREWKGIQFEIYKMIFAHQTFIGANYGGGRITDKGVPISIFPEGVRVISGDIHIPQKVGPVTYVGAPYTIDFGDDFEPRVLLIKDGKLKSIPVPGPQKRLVEVPSINDLQDVELNQGDILKVRVCIDMKDYAKWPKYQDRVRKWGIANGYQVHVVQPVVTGHKTDPSVRHEQRDQQTDEQILESYAKQRGVDERTLKVGLGLMDDAS